MKKTGSLSMARLPELVAISLLPQTSYTRSNEKFTPRFAEYLKAYLLRLSSRPAY